VDNKKHNELANFCRKKRNCKGTNITGDTTKRIMAIKNFLSQEREREIEREREREN
jgi:hypothetical protein